MPRENVEGEESLKLYYVDMKVISASGVLRLPTQTGLSLKNDNSGDPFNSLVETIDAYCEVCIDEMTQATKILPKQTHPVWNDRLEFVCPGKPKKATFTVINDDVKAVSDVIGSGEFMFGDMFESERSFEGSIRLSDDQRERGTLKIAIQCSTLDPLQVKRQLSSTRKQLSQALQQNEHTKAQLHQAELNYQHKLDEVQSEHRQEIFIYEQRIQQVDRELANSKKKLNRVDVRYQKTQAELKNQLLQLRLKEASKDEQLTNMEKEILAAADKVLHTEQQQKSLQSQLEQTQAQVQTSNLKLTHTRSIVLQQAEELEKKANSFKEELTHKEQEILNTGKKLAQMTQEVEQAKMEQNQKQAELDALKEKLLDQQKKQQQEQEELERKKRQEEEQFKEEKKEAASVTNTRGFTDESTEIPQYNTEVGVDNTGTDFMACGVINACDEDCCIM